MEMVNCSIMIVMVLGMICGMVPGGRRQARRGRLDSNTSSELFSEDLEAPDNGWTPLYVTTKAKVEVEFEAAGKPVAPGAATSCADQLESIYAFACSRAPREKGQ